MEAYRPPLPGVKVRVLRPLLGLKVCGVPGFDRYDWPGRRFGRDSLSLLKVQLLSTESSFTRRTTRLYYDNGEAYPL